MEKYPKINSIFKRTSDGSFIEEYSKPEFEYLYYNQWRFEEKVDGRNHRIIRVDGEIEHRGRTDNAQFHPDHLMMMHEKGKDLPMQDVFGDTDVCLYGELYGEGIQSGGNYSDSVDFVLFDVKIGKYWLEREDVEDIANKMDIDVVPVVGGGTLEDAIEKVREGFYSEWSRDDCTFFAEGLVLKPEVQLFNRRGERVITKIKTEDFS